MKFLTVTTPRTPGLHLPTGNHSFNTFPPAGVLVHHVFLPCFRDCHGKKHQLLTKIYDMSLQSSQRWVSLMTQTTHQTGRIWFFEDLSSLGFSYSWLKSCGYEVYVGVVVFKFIGSKARGNQSENELGLDSIPITRYSFYTCVWIITSQTTDIVVHLLFIIIWGTAGTISLDK